ncbi:MAG: ATP-binding protein [Thermodesulfobacteriota bacterium]|nr:ATP-binding protein [Thermodesulfobacteriota bacterium]
MILTEEDIKTWDFQNLKEWLKNLITHENNQFDFIENLQQRNEPANDRIRSKFCSFANEKDGFLFFGIRDSDKEPVGIVNIQQEFTTKLNRIVSTKIFPEVPPQNYKVIHCMGNYDNRNIFIVKIIKSSRNLIPHMLNCKIYIRENGESKPIKDGKTLKGKFSQRF